MFFSAVVSDEIGFAEYKLFLATLDGLVFFSRMSIFRKKKYVCKVSAECFVVSEIQHLFISFGRKMD